MKLVRKASKKKLGEGGKLKIKPVEKLNLGKLRSEFSPTNLSETHAHKPSNAADKKLKVALKPYSGGSELEGLMAYIDKKRFKGRQTGELKMNTDMTRDIKTANNSHIHSGRGSVQDENMNQNP